MNNRTKRRDATRQLLRRNFNSQQLLACLPTYIKDDVSCIREVSRILKQGGYAVAGNTNWLSIRNSLNLIQTDLWSGGDVEYASWQQVHSSATFDCLFARKVLVLIGQLNLCVISVLDKEPLNRKGASGFFGGHRCFNHVAIYQELPSEFGENAKF